VVGKGVRCVCVYVQVNDCVCVFVGDGFVDGKDIHPHFLALNTHNT